MEKVKIRDKSNGAIIEVAKALASDYIMTGNFEYVKEPIKNLRRLQVDLSLKTPSHYRLLDV